MRTTSLSALFFFASVARCFEESPWQPVSYDYYHIDLSELGGHPRVPLHDHGAFGSKVPIPRDVIVDVINDLGIKLLAIHNEHNENNVAISPYGAFSVLAALSEGLQGDAANEILHAAHMPKDKHIIRVGLRDIHRHLKSYFIPEEGFLAGLTLNLNNVTLRSEYEDVLRFYGFDYGSFNNALYPEPPTTRKPSEATTLETGLGVSEGTGTTSTSKPELTTTDILTRSGEGSSTVATTTDFDSTTSTTTTRTLAREDETTTAAVSTTTLQQITTTVETPSTIKSEVLTTTTTTEASTESPTTKLVTVPSPLPTTTTTTAAATTSEATEKTNNPTTEMKEDSTEPVMTSSIPETTTKLPETTTATIVKESTTETHKGGFLTSKVIESTIVSLATAATTVSMQTASVTMGTTMVSSNTVRTTRQATFPTEPEGQLTTIISPTQATAIIPQNTIVTDAATIPPSTTTATFEDSFNDTAVQSDFPDSPAGTLPQFDDQEQDTMETTTPFFFGATPDFQDDMTNLPPNQNFDFNYNYDSNSVPPPPVYDDGMVDNNVMPNPPEARGLNNNFRRTARSIVDYVIARFYDDHHHYAAPSPGPPYVPQEPLAFAVYGKYRESRVNFMKYDTVLPYFFAQNLKAVALSFPLDSTKYYLLLLLPTRENAVDQLICDLRLYGNLRYIIDNLRLTHVTATIPSFMLKGYVTLTPALQRLGIRKIFEPRQADFTPMTNVTDIYVTNIEQAVTVTIRNYLDSSAQHYKNVRQYPPVDFKADHPFLYFVIDSELHVALMMGKVINPLNSRIS